MTDMALCLQNLFDFDSYCVNTVQCDDFIYILMCLKVTLDVRMCTEHIRDNFPCTYFTPSPPLGAWSRGGFIALHQQRTTSTCTIFHNSKSARHTGSSDSRGLRTPPSLRNERTCNNHISIVIWGRSSGNDLFALNYQRVNSFCLCVHIVTAVQSNIYGL